MFTALRQSVGGGGGSRRKHAPPGTLTRAPLHVCVSALIWFFIVFLEGCAVARSDSRAEPTFCLDPRATGFRVYANATV